MQKWQYAHAHYDGATLTPHGEMSDVVSKPDRVTPFLQEAGEKGWELCGVIPSPAAQPGVGGAVDLCLIFKRPILVRLLGSIPASPE